MSHMRLVPTAAACTAAALILLLGNRRTSAYAHLLGIDPELVAISAHEQAERVDGLLQAVTGLRTPDRPRCS